MSCSNIFTTFKAWHSKRLLMQHKEKVNEISKKKHKWIYGIFIVLAVA